MSKENGGPAFPYEFGGAYRNQPKSGMTLRDYFAAKAMQGAISSLINGEPANSGTDAALAKASYMIADAMLKERAE